MNKYVLTCGSTADLSLEHYKNRNIECIPFHYYLGDQECIDDFGQTISYPTFYQAMREGIITKTVQINVEEIKDFLEQFLKKGLDVVHVTLSSGLSGSYNSALIAKEELQKQYPERKIVIIDSLGASSGYGLLMDTLADLRDLNYSIEDLQKTAVEIRSHLQHVFFSTDLTYYMRGGRVSKTAGFFGNLLHICPLLDVNDEGKLIPRKKLRGKKKAMEALVKVMEEKAYDGLNYHCKCYISHSDCYDDALMVKKMIEDKFVGLRDKIEINDIGTTIGSHSGPGTVAVFFYGELRKN